MGASVLAAAAGTVQSTAPDGFTAGRFTVQLTHQAGSKNYRTVYTSISVLGPGIAPGAPVTAGQPLGIAGIQTRTIGTLTTTYAMTHFQLDDFSYSGGLTNMNAVSPEAFLSSTGKALFEQIWTRAAFSAEQLEPFASNSRDVAYPQSRVWTRDTGDFFASIEFRRSDARTNDFDYVLRSENGSASETGTVRVEPLARPWPRIDLVPQGGASRPGIYNILDDRMEISLSSPGGNRPSDLATASVYRTAR